MYVKLTFELRYDAYLRIRFPWSPKKIRKLKGGGGGGGEGRVGMSAWEADPSPVP